MELLEVGSPLHVSVLLDFGLEVKELKRLMIRMKSLELVKECCDCGSVEK